MIVKSLALSDFRNYDLQELSFHHGINIFYGDNAQGKTNILEGIYLCMTNKSYRGSHDREMIRFGKEEAHLRLEAEKKGIPYRVYLHFLTHYNKCLTQRNALLKEIDLSKDAQAMLDVWDAQLIQYGKKIVQLREVFVGEIAPVIAQIYHSLTGGREQLAVSYEPNVSADRFDEILFLNREREIRQKTTLTGPHRDDIRFRVQNMATGQTTDIRTFGSQGQQRSAALALKLAEIEIVKRKVNDTPVLLLDDVLSELDSSRQNYLLDSIHDIQTFITCTGLEEFVRHRFHMDQIYHVERGVVTRVNSLNSETIF